GNQLFMGARGKQSYIFQYHPASDEFKNISLPLPFKVGDDFEVHDLVADQTGMIWLASSKGLLKHDGKAIKHIALEQSNLFECVQLALAPDSSIWLGTNGFGVYRYKNGEYARFGSYEGIPSKISSYRAMLFDQDGRLWFGTHEGMVISNYHFNTHTVPKPELKRIASGYKRISSFDKPVQLPYRTPIYFTLASSSFPYHRQRYEYEVLHWQKEQKSVVIKSEGTHDHEITLNPLEGGTYELRARSLQLSGQMRSEPLIYKFTVQPIWYKRPWVLIAFALLMTLGMILIIRWNTLRLKASNSRLERKVDTRTKALLQSEEELRQNAEELKAINTNLERTQQNLQESLLKEKAGRKALEQTFLELKSAQDQLIESEKLAALGNLLAGVAHEINSPLGAIRSSSSYLVDCITFFEEYPKKFDKLAEEQKNHLFVLMEFAMRKDSLELFQSKRKARKELAKVLESYGIETNHELLESLLQIGIKHPSEAIIQVLQAENANEVIELAQEVSFFIKAIRNVNYGSERALKIVTALKNYARKNSTNDKQLASLKEGIESTLILYQHHIRHNTKLIWEYDEIPPIYCYPDELNQVWTNLFNNAIQAMESVDDGKLTVFLRKIGNQAQVTVKDNGKGIPDRVKARIFEPFFTTKPSGIGTGIGLDIVKKIIDKHQGRIELDSIEGKGTTIKIIIPLREPENG
ncbi:MAG: ATP-binding protein, partial [Flammeovirgaceae bacterium]